MLLWCFLSILPFYESRYTIPLIALHGGNLLDVLLVSVLNSLVFFPVRWFLENIHKRVLKFNTYSRVFSYFAKRIERNKKYVEKYGYLGLSLFVFLPVPVTGVYSASVLSWLLNLDRKNSYFSVLVGVTGINILLYLSLSKIITVLP